MPPNFHWVVEIVRKKPNGHPWLSSDKPIMTTTCPYFFQRRLKIRMVPYLYLTDQEPFRFFFSCLSLSLSLFRTRGFFGEIGD